MVINNEAAPAQAIPRVKNEPKSVAKQVPGLFYRTEGDGIETAWDSVRIEAYERVRVKERQHWSISAGED